MASTPAGTEASAAETATGRRVMIVDDDVSCLSAIEQIVTFWGHETVSFQSFEDARAYLTRQTPDVAIVDVRLGDYNGLQLVHLVQQTSPGTLLVAVSGFDDPVLRAEAHRLGAVYMTKPVNLAELRQRLTVQAPSGSGASSS